MFSNLILRNSRRSRKENGLFFSSLVTVSYTHLDVYKRQDSDGTLNEDYCKWCYADGTYTYSNMDDLIDVCVKNMINENFTEEQVRAYICLLYTSRCV